MRTSPGISVAHLDPLHKHVHSWRLGGFSIARVAPLVKETRRSRVARSDDERTDLAPRGRDKPLDSEDLGTDWSIWRPITFDSRHSEEEKSVFAEQPLHRSLLLGVRLRGRRPRGRVVPPRRQRVVRRLVHRGPATRKACCRQPHACPEGTRGVPRRPADAAIGVDDLVSDIQFAVTIPKLVGVRAVILWKRLGEL